MATTIITKNGSGAPVAGDLVQGELAVDLTNKTLYSKDSSGNVFKVGDTGGGSPGTFTDLVATNSFTSPGIDDNATSTAITIDANENVGIGTPSPLAPLHISDNASGTIARFHDGVAANLYIEGSSSILRLANRAGSGQLGFTVNNGASDAMRIDASGNVGIGTSSSLTAKLNVDNGGSGDIFAFVGSVGAITSDKFGNRISFSRGSSNAITASETGANLQLEVADFMSVNTGGSEAMRIAASGNVGIGETNPESQLTIGSAATDVGQLRIYNTGSTSSGDSEIWLGGSSARKAVIAAERGGSNSHSLVFSTNPGSSDSIERMRISANGNVGIGNTLDTRRLYLGDNVQAEESIGFNLPANGEANFAVSRNSCAFTWSGPSGERMRIDSSGNVGIGNSSPSDAYVTADNLVLGNTSDTYSGMTLFTSPAGSQRILFADGTTGTDNRVGQILYDHAQNYMSLSTDASEAMRIDSDGNVGIGTANPTNSPNYSTLDLRDTSGGQVILGRTSTIDGYLYSQSGLMTVAAGVGNEMAFLTNSSGGGAGERMRLDTAGNLLVGRTSPTFGTGIAGVALLDTGRGLFEATSDAVLAINRQDGTGSANIVQFYRGNNLAGTITAASGAAPTFAANSDIRLKDNVVDHESELANVMALRPTRWDWKDEALGTGEGFIAQELEQTAWSDLVSEGDDGFKTVAGLGAVETRLIKAIQEQQAMIETLQAEVAALKGA